MSPWFFAARQELAQSSGTSDRPATSSFRRIRDAAGPGPWEPSGRGARALRTIEQTRFERLQHRARAVAHAELGEDAGDVVLDRALRRAQGVGDLLVAIAAGHQAYDLHLALRQALDRRGRPAAGALPRGPAPHPPARP